MDEQNQAGIICELNEHDDLNSAFVNRIVILPKNGYAKLVIDARYLNSIRGTNNSSWPVELLHDSMTRVKKAYLRSSDLSWAFHQVPLFRRNSEID